MEATISDVQFGSVSTPDLVLSFIPGPILLGLVVGLTLGIPLTVALAVGSVPAAAATGYALFYAPPE